MRQLSIELALQHLSQLELVHKKYCLNERSQQDLIQLLGTEGDLGGMLGLDKAWASRAIAVNGNYGEIFEKNIGVNTPIGIARGLNASWTDGGLIYSAPFR